MGKILQWIGAASLISAFPLYVFFSAPSKLGNSDGSQQKQPEVLGKTSKRIKVTRDYDCSDFSSRKEAQRFFLEEGGPENDPHGLDRDSDGLACESL